MFLTLIVGCISIGIILSAPMGPIGILCVQRTLNNGRMSGFYTGVGAAASDLFYCLLTGLGLSIITDWIQDHLTVLQILGSAFLIAYAIYMILHNPVATVKDTNTKGEPTRDMLTGFFFTLSNPLIVLLIIPLFARFGFPLPEHQFYHIIVGYICIVAGALLWWTIITFSVDKVRSHFRISGMWLINRIMGTLLLMLSLFGLIRGILDFIKV